jgi:hypothetical protein
MPVDLSDYVEVSERIERFRERHPEGSLQARFIDVPPPFNESFIAVEVRAFRTADDERPGIDIAWEPVPGKTQWTKDSEVMNASTSAAGRAIVYALAADAHRGIASANEVRAREYTEGTGTQEQLGFASEKQEKYLRRLIGTDADQNLICGYLEQNFSGGRNGGISRAIDGLKEESTRADTLAKLEALAKDWDAQQQHAAPPPDDADLPQLDDLARD